MQEGIVAWAEIDLDAIQYNVRALQKHVGPNVEIIAVVKGNAYGHGAVPVARAALKAGAAQLAVHRVHEGIELRKAGITAPILVMGYTPPCGAELIVRWGLTPSLMTMEFAQALSSQAIALGKHVPVHVKVDTGMNRYGLLPEEVTDFLLALRCLPGITLEGMFTHFATANSADQSYLRRQLAVFNEVRAAISEAGIYIPYLHACNSGAAMRLPEAHFQGVRTGIAMYGLKPSDEWEPPFEIHPVLTLKSLVSRVRTLPAGASISYGRTFITEHPTPTALVSLGYGDGYHRILSNQGSVLIHGRRAHILGRVCMDQFVVDISAIPQVSQDDEVVLIGTQGEERISAEEVANLAGTINYEITTSLLPRLARLYLKGGKVVEANILGEEPTGKLKR